MPAVRVAAALIPAARVAAARRVAAAVVAAFQVPAVLLRRPRSGPGLVPRLRGRRRRHPARPKRARRRWWAGGGEGSRRALGHGRRVLRRPPPDVLGRRPVAAPRIRPPAGRLGRRDTGVVPGLAPVVAALLVHRIVSAPAPPAPPRAPGRRLSGLVASVVEPADTAHPCSRPATPPVSDHFRTWVRPWRRDVALRTTPAAAGRRGAPGRDGSAPGRAPAAGLQLVGERHRRQHPGGPDDEPRLRRDPVAHRLPPAVRPVRRCRRGRRGRRPCPSRAAIATSRAPSDGDAGSTAGRRPPRRRPSPHLSANRV